MKVEHTKRDHSEAESSRNTASSHPSLLKGKRLFLCIGALIVPSGKNITLTYSGGTPTWSWTLL